MYLEPIAEGIAKGKRDDISEGDVVDTVFTHDQNGNGRNYEWLFPFYGRFLWADFCEPAGSSNWQPYQRSWWARHACLIRHSPAYLVQDHVNYYVDPETRKIELKFWFERVNGEVYSMAPTVHFYLLEREYFLRNRLCQGKGAFVMMINRYRPPPYAIDVYRRKKREMKEETKGREKEKNESGY